MPSTEQLFLRFRRRGDASALGEVFDRTAEDLFKLALYLGPEAADAEDLVQATYLTAIEAARNFDARRRLLPWLLGILSNHARKARDQYQRRRVLDLDRLAVPASDAGLRDNPETNAEHAELHATLERAVARLPQPYRQVLVLHLEHGLNARKISEVLERPSGTVRSQVVRGLEQLRRLLPVGLTAGALVVSPGHVLAAVRADVMRAAEASTLTTAGTFWTGAHSAAAGVLASILALVTAWWGVAADRETPSIAVVADASAPDPTARNDAGAPAPQPAPRETRTPVPSASRPAAKPRGTAVLEVALTVDDAPAPAGVLVELLPAIPPHTLIHVAQMRGARRFATSDASGRVTFEDVPRGQATLLLAGSLVHQKDFEVRATAAARIEFPLPRLRALTGVVVDAIGLPGPEASVWMSTTANEECVGAVVARTDERGRFAFLAPPGRVSLWAVQDGAGPSPVVLASTAKTIELPLTLSGSGLACRVEDENGRTLAGATVQVMPRRVDRAPFAPVFGRCDESGTTRLAHLPPGPAVVVARKPGFATVTGPAELAPGDNALTLRLPRGAAIEGTVRRTDGSALPGVALLAEVADGDVGAHDAKLRRVMTVSDANGRFVLGDLPHGVVRVRVVDPSGCTWIASRRFDLRAGQRVSWDPRESADHQIRGRVVDPDGKPVAGYAIVATPVGPDRLVDQYRRRIARSTADGSFALRPLERGVAYHVGVFEVAKKMREVDALALGTSLRPGAELHTFEIDPRALAGHQGVTGRLQDPNGSIVSEGHILVRRMPLRYWEQVAFRGGTFRIDLLPGRYELGIELRGYGTHFLPPLEVEKGRHRELDTVRLPALGSFDLRLEGEARITIVDARGRVLFAKRVRERLRRSLPPGRYVAALQRTGVVPERRDFTVRSRRETDIELQTRRGRPCALVFTFDPLDNTFDDVGKLHLVLRSESGEVIADTHVGPERLDAFGWRVSLLPGEYRIAATSVWGGQCDRSFRVDDGTGAVRIEAALEVAR